MREFKKLIADVLVYWSFLLDPKRFVNDEVKNEMTLFEAEYNKECLDYPNLTKEDYKEFWNERFFDKNAKRKYNGK